MQFAEVSAQVVGLGEPDVTHGAVVGLLSCVGRQVVFKKLPAVEHTAAHLGRGERSFYNPAYALLRDVMGDFYSL